MTEKDAKEKLVSWALSQVGYHEIPDNNTKYADTDFDERLYGFSMAGQPWCDFLVDYAFIHCFGYDLGTRMTYQSPSGSALCKTSAGFYQQNGAWTQTPEVGDQIFFYYSGDINHTGIVVDINSSYITTIEGNSSDSVRKNQYRLNDNSIAGYGRPKWSLVECECEDTAEEENDVPIQHRRTYFHLERGDGMNNPISRVKAWQIFLNAWGYSLEADGEFGDQTYASTLAWQELCKETYCGDVEVNGVVDEDDWIEIIKIPY